MKKIILVILLAVLSITLVPTKANAEYSSDYRLWTNSGTSYTDTLMPKSGCYVVAQSQLLVALGIEDATTFNPDRYAEWEVKNGYLLPDALKGGKNFNMQNTSYEAPLSYARENYLITLKVIATTYKLKDQNGQKVLTEEYIKGLAKKGYSIIVGINTHYVLLDNEDTINQDKLIVYDAYHMTNDEFPELNSIMQKFNYTYKDDNGELKEQKGFLYAVYAYKKDTKSYETITEGNYYLKNVGDGKYMTVDTLTDAKGKVIKTASHTSTKQQISIINKKNEGYVLKPIYTKRRILNAYASPNKIADKTKVNLFDVDSVASSTQTWKFEKVSNGYVIHIASNSDYVLTALDNTVVLRKRDTSNNNQVWKLENKSYDLSKATVTNIKSKTYTGSIIKQKPTIKIGNITLVDGIDYKVSYKNNINIGTATMTVTGINKNKGSISKTFKITQQTVDKLIISGVKNKYYTGKNIILPIVISNGTNNLKEKVDYTVSYKNNKKVGTATVTIKGKGNYKGTITKTFKISKQSISKFTVSGITNQKYTGKNITQKITVNNGTKELKEKVDYTISYKNNKKIGKATITITGKGIYTGTITKTFKIYK